MALPVIVNKDDNATAGASSLTITFVATPSAGNLLIAAVDCDAARTITTPAGWTLAVNRTSSSAGYDNRLAVYYKTSSGAEASVVFSFSGSTSASAASIEFSGTDLALHALTDVGDTDGDNSIIGPTVAGVPTDCMSIAIGGCSVDDAGANNLTTVTANWTRDSHGASSPTPPSRAVAFFYNSTDTGSVTGPTMQTAHSQDSADAVSFFLGFPASDSARYSLMMSM